MLRFDELIDQCPPELKARILNLKNVPQRKDFHKEGDVLTHVNIVVNRLAKYNDLTLSWAGMFHDIGKDETTKMSDKGILQALGHEDVSAALVDTYKDFLNEMGVKYWLTKEIVQLHMRIKRLEDLKQSKSMELYAHRCFGYLMLFRDADNMSTLRPEELEEVGLKGRIKRLSKEFIGRYIQFHAKGLGTNAPWAELKRLAQKELDKLLFEAPTEEAMVRGLQTWIDLWKE